MLGHRGCRLGNTYPEITEMQARAIIEAAMNVKKQGIHGTRRDHGSAGRHAQRSCAAQKGMIDAMAAARCSPSVTIKIDYMVGTMIEIPRAAVDREPDRRGGRVLLVRHQRPDADDLRLTRATTSAKFLPDLPRKGHSQERPVPDPSTANGVGQLVREAVFKGRTRVKPNSNAASAANTAASRHRSSSATTPG